MSKIISVGEDRELRSMAMVKSENVPDAYPIAMASVICAVLIVLFMGIIQYSCIDYYQFWTIGQCIKSDPGTKIYDEGEQHRLGKEYYDSAQVQPNATRLRQAAEYNQVLKTTASPFLYSCFATLTTGDYEHDLLQYQFFTMACLLAAIYLLHRLTQTSLLATLIFVPFILVFFSPYTSEAKVGNVNQIQLLLFAIIVMAQINQTECLNFLSGMVMGLSLAFKPTCLGIVFLLCAYALARSPRRLLYAILGGIAVGMGMAVAFSSWVFGRLSCWSEWVANARTYADHPQWSSTDMGNISFTYTFLNLTGLDFSLPLAVITLGAPLLILFRSKNRRFIGESSFLMATLGALSFLLFSKLVWQHYELLSLPAIFILTRPGPAFFSYQRAVTAGVLVMMFIEVRLVLTLGFTSLILPFWTLVDMGILYALCLGNLWRLERVDNQEVVPAPLGGK